MNQFLRVCCLLVLAASAAHADKVAPPVADEHVTKFLAFFDKLADTVVADKSDCGKMATDVNKLIDDNKQLLADAKAAQTSGKQLPPEARNHMMETAKRMSSAMMEKCSNDAGVKAAFDRLPKHGPPAKH